MGRLEKFLLCVVGAGCVEIDAKRGLTGEPQEPTLHSLENKCRPTGTRLMPAPHSQHSRAGPRNAVVRRQSRKCRDSTAGGKHQAEGGTLAGVKSQRLPVSRWSSR